MRKTKYTVKYTTGFKKDYKRAIKRGLKSLTGSGDVYKRQMDDSIMVYICQLYVRNISNIFPLMSERSPLWFPRSELARTF